MPESTQHAWRKPARFPPPLTPHPRVYSRTHTHTHNHTHTERRPPAPLDTAPVPLRIHLWSIPAHGHYMTLRDIGVNLAARGHNVSFCMCERSHTHFREDGLEDINADRTQDVADNSAEHSQESVPSVGTGRSAGGGHMDFISLGACPSYDAHDEVMRDLIAHESIDTVQRMLRGVVDLNTDMYTHALTHTYKRLAHMGQLPHVVVFDADTFAAMDISIQFRIPRVARVGTGIRDAYANPVTVPQYASARPAGMGFVDRLANAATLVLSRWILSPMVLPGLQASRRDAVLASSERTAARRNHALNHADADVDEDGEKDTFPEPPLRRLFTPGAAHAISPYHKVDDSALMGYDPDRFRVDLPWDGVPTLLNTHWGLEHPRPLQPFEHVIGHTTDFAFEQSKPIPECVAAWLAAAPDVPVVYVSLGTLAVAPVDLLRDLTDAMRASKDFRFIWAVPQAQQAMFPSVFTDYATRWNAACEGNALHAPATDQVEVTATGPQAAASGAPPVTPGTLLLAPWLPQVAVLMHNTTQIFLSHGGMNGVAEGTYAHTPFLCLPLFSDQPDNCQHIEDFGFGLRLSKDTLDAGTFNNALHRLSTDTSFSKGIELAWMRNVAAGGIPRAIQVIESTAYMGYGGHVHTVPAAYFMPAYSAHGFDVYATLACIPLLLLALCWWCLRACLGRLRKR